MNVTDPLTQKICGDMKDVRLPHPRMICIAFPILIHSAHCSCTSPTQVRHELSPFMLRVPLENCVSGLAYVILVNIAASDA